MNKDDLDKYEANLRAQMEEFRRDMETWKAERERIDGLKNPLVRFYEYKNFQVKVTAQRWRFYTLKWMGEWLAGWREVLNLFEGD